MVQIYFAGDNTSGHIQRWFWTNKNTSAHPTCIHTTGHTLFQHGHFSGQPQGRGSHHGGIYGAVARCSWGSHCAALHILTAMFLWRALQAQRNGNTLGWPWLAPLLRLLGKLATTQPHSVTTYPLLFSIHLTKPIKNFSPLNLVQPPLQTRLHQALLWVTKCSAFLLCHLWATQLPQHRQAQGNHTFCPSRWACLLQVSAAAIPWPPQGSLLSIFFSKY